MPTYSALTTLADKDRAEEFRAVLQLLQYFRTDLKPYLRP